MVHSRKPLSNREKEEMSRDGCTERRRLPSAADPTSEAAIVNPEMNASKITASCKGIMSLLPIYKRCFVKKE